MPAPTATVPLTGKPAASFKRDNLVLLGEFDGTVAQRKLVWRVTAIPNPRGKRKADRDTYEITPVIGGASMRAYAGQLLRADVAVVRAWSSVEPVVLHPGSTVRPEPGARISGTDPFTELVVLKVHADATVDLAPAGAAADGRVWSRVPLTAVARA